MEVKESTKEVGFVVHAKGYLVSLEGLPNARINDIVVDDEGHKAIIASIEDEYVNALLLSDTDVRSGDRFTLQDKGLEFSIGEHLFGRVIDIFGNPIDGKGSLPKKNVELAFETVAPGVSSREEISSQFETGITAIDMLYPIGKGQRQLLFGPTSSGKTGFIQDVIVNQKGKDVICIYTGIGKPTVFLERFAKTIFSKGASDYTIVMGARAEEHSSVSAIAPTVALFMAEYFCRKGKQVFLVLDDLGTHAKYMREISLLMGQIPGRQSYPGDIFYQHAHLLELAGNFNEKFGSSSITVLPMIETDIENFTDLVPTNLMSMTDGHLFFSPELRAEGYYPSVAIEKSVTRVGRQTQTKIQKELSTRIMMLFSEFRKQQEYSRFGTNLSAKTRDTLRRGELVLELLKQEQYANLSLGMQIALLSLVFTDFLEKRERPFLEKHKDTILHTLENDSRLQEVRKEALREGITLDEFLKTYNAKVGILEAVCHQ